MNRKYLKFNHSFKNLISVSKLYKLLTGYQTTARKLSVNPRNSSYIFVIRLDCYMKTFDDEINS